ncbi:unnamed protein product [Candida verbasci]|uniref:Peptide transporter PTR2 n=1 Tax=Candida verbasci TaxID=1227364 RepID=A0A9W4X8J9_9ASCO|nr:unnamed protein product [Candida verbasci]
MSKEIAEKDSAQKVSLSTYSSTSEEDYDFNDPANYTQNYVDDLNPKGLRRPTKKEVETLRRVLGKIKFPSLLICAAELAERASYYSVLGILTNFIQRPMPDGSRFGNPTSNTSNKSAGALGLGLRTATAITLLTQFLAYVLPLVGSILADVYIGRFRAINYGVWVGGVSHILFIIAAIPGVITNVNASLAIIVLSVLTLAIGTGLIKPNLLPLIMDQYPEETDVVKVLKSGEKVIIDREKTLQRISLIFYFSINVGAFFQLATSYTARRVGFWLSFLLPGIFYLLLPLFLWMVKPKLKLRAPEGSALTNFMKIFHISFKGNWIKRLRNNTFWEFAKPSVMKERGIEYYNEKKQSPITWTDQWVLDVRQTVNACKIFVYFIVFNLAASGIGSVTVSLSGSLTNNGVPNDLFNNFNPLTIIILLPILNNIIYPLMRRYHIEFRPIFRIALGLILGSIGQMVGAILQAKVYQTSPCGNMATTCSETSPISIWWASLVFIFGAAGECFANTTAYELAYTRSPAYLKGVVMAIFLFMMAISALVSQAALPALVDPYLVYPFAVISGLAFVVAILLIIQFRNLHKEMELERIQRESMDKEESRKEELDNNLNAIISIKSNALSVAK